MRNLRKQDGFTLIELLVAIAVGALVTAAAVTVLLLGLRLDNHSRQTITQQNATRVVLNLVENIAAENDIDTIITTVDSWYLCSDLEGEHKKSVVIGYTSVDGTIQTGGELTITNADAVADNCTYDGGTAVLRNVIASYANFDKKNNLLTVSVETEEGTYKTSSYCRLVPDEEHSGVVDDIVGEITAPKDPPNGGDNQTTNPNGTDIARLEFLKVAISQLGSSGTILEKVQNGEDFNFVGIGRTFAQWYNSVWSKDTPWCACFVVWALDECRWNIKGKGIEIEVKEPTLLQTPLNRTDYNLAHVDAFARYLKEIYNSKGELTNADSAQPGWYPSRNILNQYGEPEREVNETEKIKMGDLIFFDWTVDFKQEDYDGDHVGIVLTVLDENDENQTDLDKVFIYTIEGNTADMVAVRKYAINDPRIMGFGVLDWMTNAEMNSGGSTN